MIKHSFVFLILLTTFGNLMYAMEDEGTKTSSDHRYSEARAKAQATMLDVRFLGIPDSFLENPNEQSVIWLKKHTIRPGYVVMKAYFNEDITQILVTPFDNKTWDGNSKTHDIWDVKTKTIIHSFFSDESLRDKEHVINGHVFNKQRDIKLVSEFDQIASIVATLHQLHDEDWVCSLHATLDGKRAVSAGENFIYVWKRYANWTAEQLHLLRWFCVSAKGFFGGMAREQSKHVTVTRESLVFLLQVAQSTSETGNLYEAWNTFPTAMQTHICEGINKIIQNQDPLRC